MIKYIAPAPADSNRYGGRESNPTFTLIFSHQLLSVYQFRHLTIYTPKSPLLTNRETGHNWDLSNQFTYSILPSAAATSTASSAFALAGRPLLTVPPLAAAFAANSAKRF